jgi:hypothetical protein
MPVRVTIDDPHGLVVFGRRYYTKTVVTDDMITFGFAFDMFV